MKARIPKMEDEKERKVPDSSIQVWQRSQRKTTLEREEGVEYAKRKKRVEEVLKGTGEGLEEMKIIQRERRRRSTEEANEQV